MNRLLDVAIASLEGFEAKELYAAHCFVHASND
jgi:hypothetical protein